MLTFQKLLLNEINAAAVEYLSFGQNAAIHDKEFIFIRFRKLMISILDHQIPLQRRRQKVSGFPSLYSLTQKTMKLLCKFLKDIKLVLWYFESKITTQNIKIIEVFFLNTQKIITKLKTLFVNAHLGCDIRSDMIIRTDIPQQQSSRTVKSTYL